MPRTLDDSPNAVGSRILQLLGERDLSLRQLSRASKIPYRTLQRWIRQVDPPKIRADRQSRIEEVLGGRIIPAPETTREQEGAMVMEGKGFDYSRLRHGTVRAQRIDFRQHALHASGRARHALARAIKYLNAQPPDVRGALEALSRSDGEMAVAQRILMSEIETNDNGDPI